MDPLRGDTFSPAEEDDSGTVALLAVVAALLAVGVSTAIVGVSSAASAELEAAAAQQAQTEEALTVYDVPAQDVQVAPARTDGPIYDLPGEVAQQIVCDQHNREYLLLTTEQGGVCLVPYLDENGEQAVMPQA